MRLANGMGTCYKLKGNRRKPWVIKVTAEISFDETTMKYHQKQVTLGYYKTKQEALTALMEYGKYPYDLDNLTATLGDIYQKISKDFTENQIKSIGYAYKYLEPIADLPIRTIKAGQIQACVDSCTNTQQPLIKTLCNKIYEYALINEIVDRNPSQYVKAVAPKAKIERQVFTHEQVEELWTLTEFWWAKITLMLLYSGMRTKELRCVPLENIDTQNKWLDLAAGKNEASVRGMPLHERTVPLFCDYIENGGNLYGWSHGYLNKHLSEFYDHSAHDCRHTFATRMREIGTDELVIKRLLGHTPSDITQRIYTHLTQEELTAAINKLEF